MSQAHTTGLKRVQVQAAAARQKVNVCMGIMLMGVHDEPIQFVV